MDKKAKDMLLALIKAMVSINLKLELPQKAAKKELKEKGETKKMKRGQNRISQDKTLRR